MTGVGLAPRRPVLAEDVRDLQRWTRHDSRGQARGLRLVRGLACLTSLGRLLDFGLACLRAVLNLSGSACLRGSGETVDLTSLIGVAWLRGLAGGVDVSGCARLVSS